MLKLIDTLLMQWQLLPPKTRLHYHVNITSGESLAISAFISPHQFFQIKASEFMDLRGQHEAYRRGWAVYRDFMAKPLAYQAVDGWSIMVTEGLQHVPAHASDLRRQRADGRSLADHALAFFSTPAPANTTRGAHDALLGAVDTFFASHALASLAQPILRNARAAGVSTLPAVPQHGDLVINNLAYGERRFIVFDWEDFGKVQWPGFDLCTLLVSLVTEDEAILRAIIDSTCGDALLNSFVQQACARQHIPGELFRRLIPFYLLVFLYLKRNYGLQIQQRIGTLLIRLHEGESVPSRAARLPLANPIEHEAR